MSSSRDRAILGKISGINSVEWLLFIVAFCMSSVGCIELRRRYENMILRGKLLVFAGKGMHSIVNIPAAL